MADKWPLGIRMPEPPGIDYDMINSVTRQMDAMRIPARELAEYSLEAASATVRALQKQVQHFESQLPEREAVLLMMIGGPSGLSFFPTRIWAQDPDKIVFEGVDQDEHPFLVVQHISQLNFALRSYPLSEEQERRPIGFILPE